MSSLPPLSPPDAAEALRQALLQGLREGRWQPGERLPTERALAAHYGIGRAVVRRVLAEFRDAGTIRQTVGSGTYAGVRPRNRNAGSIAAQPPPALPISPAELMEARLRLEPMLVELAVTRATPTDFEAMDECCRRAESATTLSEFERWDGALHLRIAEASRNAFFIAVFRMVNQVRACSEWGMLKQRSVTPQRRARYQREHRALVAALKARDMAQAKERIIAHLQAISQNLLEGR